MKGMVLVVFLAVIVVMALQPAANAQGGVLVVSISSDIAKPTVELVTRSIDEASAGGARLIVYELNTPGGDLDSVTQIMNAFNSSPIPVVVWVTPSGAAAWSGGTYILMASDIAVMASGTTIGSAQPVSATGEPINETKIINALTGLMRDNARLHDRNETAAQQFITQNINLGPEDALRLHLIEFAADSLNGLLKQLDPYSLLLTTTPMGTSVWKLVLSSASGSVAYSKRFDFAGISQASTYDYTPTFGVQFLTFLSNPILAVVLLLVGGYAVIIGFKTPGYGVEIAGVLMVLLAMIGFGVIGVNLAAVLLFIAGIALTLLEIKTQHGIFALAGIAIIVLASFLEFPLPGWELLAPQAVESARETLVSVALVMSGIFGIIVYKVAQARRMRVKAGPEQLIGKIGRVTRPFTPIGEVRVEGQVWRAETIGGEAKEGDQVEVINREGLILKVKPSKT
ncbi:MAG TPA: nodulation protein NfeD [Candidatus Dormibacteraeota bacterium]|nr:nodulation protein NfeD [Candidatus Dormibacteraeota bacterium]